MPGRSFSLTISLELEMTLPNQNRPEYYALKAVGDQAAKCINWGVKRIRMSSQGVHPGCTLSERPSTIKPFRDAHIKQSLEILI